MQDKWVEVVFPIAESVPETLSGDEIKLRAGELTNIRLLEGRTVFVHE